MRIAVDGFELDFTDAIDVFVFDEADSTKPRYHGLSHAMKAVDLIVELETAYLFVKFIYCLIVVCRQCGVSSCEGRNYIDADNYQKSHSCGKSHVVSILSI